MSVETVQNASRIGPLTPEPKKPRSGSGRKFLLTMSFLLPALIVLGALVVYPIFTVVRSFYSASGDQIVGFDNYVTMFTSASTFQAIKNNIIWVIVAPIACTVLGLIFAVLMEKISWNTAFKLIIFMPMAISMLAAGVIFRGMFQENPNQGVVNAAIAGVHQAFSGTTAYPGAKARPDVGVEQISGTIAAIEPITAGNSQIFPLVGIRATDIPDGAEQAGVPVAEADQITGAVFSDVVHGGGGTNGIIEEGKFGLPGVRVDAVDPDGQVATSATTDQTGAFTLSGLDPGQTYTIALPPSNFGEGFQGVSWLGPSLINLVIILSYVWIWAGFAMVMICLLYTSPSPRD